MLKQGILSLGMAAMLLLPQAYAEESTQEPTQEPTEVTQEEAVILYVDINNDAAEKLADLLDGVGASRAEAIIAYRLEHGPFLTPEDLMNVPGIGPATLEKNRDRIRIGKLDQ